MYTSDGKARGEYRTYNISKSNSGNDIGSTIELIERRFLKRERKELPDLITIDGGKAHLETIIKKLEESSIKANIISILKRCQEKGIF